MDFLKRHWKGIVLFGVTALATYLICHFSFRPRSGFAEIILPISIDATLFIISSIFRMDYDKWPWELTRREWQEIIKAGKSKRSCN